MIKFRASLKLLFVLLISLFGLFFLSQFIQKAGAENENLIKISENDNFILNPYLYNSSMQLQVPEQTKSFYLEGNILHDSQAVEITFADSTTKAFRIILAEGGKETTQEHIHSNLSAPLIFDTEIEKITYFTNGDTSVQVKKLIDTNTNQLNPVTVNSLTTASATSRRNFFGNLGLNVRLREDWGAPGGSEWAPHYAESVSKFVVHHTATNINEANPQKAIRDIYNYHYNRCANNIGSYDPNNPNCDEPHELWEDIGYNYLIDQNGVIYEGRAGGDGVTAAHSPPNSGTIGIAFVGTYTNQIPTKPARDSFQQLVARLSAYHGITPKFGDSVLGHRNRQVTDCPGEDFYNALAGIIQQIPQMVNTIPEISNIRKEAKSLTDARDGEFLNTSPDRIQMVVKANTISSSTLAWLQTEAPTAANFKTYDGFIIFEANRGFANKIVAETKALSTGAVIQPNFIKELGAWSGTQPQDYDSSVHWYADLINMENVWTEANCPGGSRCGGSGSVTVAVIDTGVAYEDFDFDAGSNYTLRKFSADPNYFNIEVPDIGDSPDGEFNEGYDRSYQIAPELTNVSFTDPYDFAWDFLCFERQGSLYECNTEELEKRNHANDDDGHGTFVATVIAGNTGDGPTNEVIGVAHNVQIMPIKAFFPNDSSMCYDSDYNNDPDCLSANNEYSLRGVSFSYLLAQSINYSVANGANVINMSLSGGGTDSILQNAIDNAVANGVVVVAAAGNNNANVANYFPGGLDNVISVGASTQTDTRASYSNFGSKLDLVAPVGNSGIPSQWYSCSGSTDTCWREDSGDVFTNFYDADSPAYAAGTSFAAPQVSAAAALLISKFPGITPAEVELTLKLNARDVGPTGKDSNTGYGVLDIHKSLLNRKEAAGELNNYRFYNVQTSAHFYTVSAAERNSVQTNLPQYIYEGPNYKVWDSNTDQFSPVYRFYNVDSGAHFYTASTVERNSVQANLPQYIYEGVSYYISLNQISGTVPLYRFYNVDTGAHFYTNSTAERNSVQANLPQYIYEGIAYYVLPK